MFYGNSQNRFCGHESTDNAMEHIGDYLLAQRFTAYLEGLLYLTAKNRTQDYICPHTTASFLQIMQSQPDSHSSRYLGLLD